MADSSTPALSLKIPKVRRMSEHRPAEPTPSPSLEAHPSLSRVFGCCRARSSPCQAHIRKSPKGNEIVFYEIRSSRRVASQSKDAEGTAPKCITDVAFKRSATQRASATVALHSAALSDRALTS